MFQIFFKQITIRYEKGQALILILLIPRSRQLYVCSLQGMLPLENLFNCTHQCSYSGNQILL